MDTFYDAMCVVRTELLNAFTYKYLGKPNKVNTIIGQIVDEIASHGDFMDNVYDLDREELEDLGFQQINYDGDIMFFPLWLLPFIPDDAILLHKDGGEVVKGLDPINVYAESWLDVGISTPED